MTNEANPFLTDIPMVAQVRAVRSVAGVLVETPVGDCKRVWFRIAPVAKAGNSRTDVSAPPTRLVPDQLGRDKLRSF
ncbi:hypothetical protein [Andreprevotia chitinilytica]|uniref:hypothetical protein n=1 Tax=Andreprevotia chitinilytica TaxID=396808 RepID=UPI00055565F3|nr:hypothetical protein [Andreprevotia chitinilytica]